MLIKSRLFEDNLWYPIVVKSPDGELNQIVEMQGKAINEWNDALERCGWKI